jgi:two-component flavin-dependent monooxygenase
MNEELELVGRAAAIGPMAAEAAAAADVDRRLAQKVIDALHDAGFARHFTASRWGGSEGTFAEVCAAVTLLARYCPSTAWHASLAATLGRIASFLPEEGQRRIWSEDPDALIVGSLLPLGTADPVDGGWLVTGAWPYISSVEFSDWALVLAVTQAPDDRRARFFAVPRDRYSIEATWNNLGMRATGSHTLILPSTFVAPGFSFDRADLDRGAPCASQVPNHLLPLEAVAGLAFAPAVVGAARGALQAWTQTARRRAALAGRGPIPQETFDTAFTWAAGTVDAAGLLVDRVARMADAGGLNDFDVAVCARDCALAAESARAATDRLMPTAGTSGLNEGQALQRFWRDVYSASSHIMLQLPRAATGFARLALMEEGFFPWT